MSGRAGHSAPIIPDAAVRKMLIYFARVYLALLFDKFQHELRELLARGRPGSRSFRRHIDFRTGMHKRLKRLRHKTVHDEEVFLDLEPGIQPLEVPGAVLFYAMTQNEVLSTCRRTDRIGLDKTHAIEGAFHCSRLEKATSNGISP